MVEPVISDILSGFRGWSIEFDLLYRQEHSRTAGGSTTTKDFGTPLWQAKYESHSLRPNELDQWRAKFKVLEGSLQRFMGWPMSRAFPIAYPLGVGMPDVSAVKLATLGANNKTLTLSGLPAGYIASVGDYIQIARNLYQIVDMSDGFEVRPHLATGTAVGNIVQLVRPSVPMIIIPNSLSTVADRSTGRGTISFQAIESR